MHYVFWCHITTKKIGMREKKLANFVSKMMYIVCILRHKLCQEGVNKGGALLGSDFLF
ncbi:hypothetical protein HanXRQr2_Chr15g0698161 [Helianthus annuus]|uniref:Uncharacterized protein n=1 Tax=Helianthus annuus TaxID=4232 RepID=A0A9K3H4Z5_HELAN|nr:hypothetical protein HanXRQr2_Chr15g0698161 [Helianthus annuus]KAJ0831680.1 hypothetical protein HanPSC8_Chr15g0669871 [Helianthus annuus]